MALQGCWSEPSAAAACEDPMTHWRGPDALSLLLVRNEYAKTCMALKEPYHPADNDSLSLTGSGGLLMVLPDLSAMLEPIGDTVRSNHNGIPSRSSCMYAKDTAHEPLGLYGDETEQYSKETKKHVFVWKVIQKEVLDWYESNTTSRTRQPGMAFRRPWAQTTKEQSLLLTSPCSSEPRQVLITIIAIQLLASCYTLSQGLSTYSPPPKSYNSGEYSHTSDFDPRLVSSLRLHTQNRHSPALGHHGRDVSAALPWPDMNIGLSHEGYHTRTTARRRKNQPKASIKDIVGGDGEGVCKTEHSTSEEVNPSRWTQFCGDEESINDSPNISICGRRYDRIFGRPRRFVGSPPTELSPSAMTEFGSSVLSPECSRADHVETRDEGRRWSFQPILRSEGHPVFVQPVKEHLIRRWRNSSSTPMSGSSSSSGFRKTVYGMRRNSGAELIAAPPY